MKSLLIRPYARYLARQVAKERKSAVEDQSTILKQLVKKGQSTAFGRDHDFQNIVSVKDFQERVSIRDYEGLKNYFDRVAKGETDVLYPGLPKYLAKTSGTTSGVKYIPITHDSLPNHINTARKALMAYASKDKNSKVFDGKVMFISGSPTLSTTGGVSTGRLSGIVNHEIPSWLKGNQLPTYSTNCIDDWEKKLDRIVEETKTQDLRLISGIPPWVQMFFERLLEATGQKHIIDVFPNLQVFMYGGVNYEPYRQVIESLIGKRIDSVELYPASEGFIAYQDKIENEGLLLNTNSGIFFEFVLASEIWDKQPARLTIEDVELNQDYAVIINNNAGLWGYNLGDTVRFVSKDPYRVIVSGRIKHFISAFGEHVIQKEVELAVLNTSSRFPCKIREYSVAPQVTPANGTTPYHEWFIEFEEKPIDLKQFALEIDNQLRQQNIYYDDLIAGNILTPLKITEVTANGFRSYMQKKGKLGGQNKVPRLTNDRKLADDLRSFLITN
ncbi:MAG: hypothetical protein ACI9FN_002094 [Saprospiraceae bacterium]|jgi:hypothetical protein